MLENIGIFSLHKLDVIFCHFEGSSLEIHVTWGARQHKTEIYVDDVPRCIDQDIIIMSIFYLEEILNERVPCQALYEICDRLLPVNSIKLLVYFS